MNKFLRAITGALSLIFTVTFLLILLLTSCSPQKNSTNDSEHSADNSCYFYDDFIISCLDDNAIEIILYKGSDSNVVIPPKINNKTVVSIHSCAFFAKTNIVTVSIPSGVTSIGDQAFYHCTKLEQVTIPSALTYIGEEAFANSGLQYIYIPGGVSVIETKAFHQCHSLKSAVISSGVQIIKEAAFYGCSSLSFINIPNTVTEVETLAFYGCSSATSLTLSNSMTVLEKDVFNGCGKLTSLVIPSSVEIIREGSLGGCGLEYLNIPPNVRIIEELSFQRMRALTQINVDKDNQHYCSVDGVLYTRDRRELLQCPCAKTGAINVESDCKVLMSNSLSGSSATAINLPLGLEKISSGVFSYCESLTEIIIPSSVVSVGESCFYACSNLKYIEFNAQTNIISSNMFGSCSSLISFQIPSSVKELGPSCFRGSGLKAIVIPDGVEAIGDGAFSGCKELLHIYLPSSIKSIGNNAFYNSNSVFQQFFYGGSADDFDRIEISKNSDIKSKIVRYGCDGSKFCVKENTKYTVLETDNNECVFINILDKTQALFDLHLEFIKYSSIKIGAYAFYDWGTNKKIVIPNNLSGLGSFAFGGNTTIGTIYFYGTSAEYYGNSCLVKDTGECRITNSGVYFFSETRPEKNQGLYWCYVDGVPTRWDKV